MSNEIKMEVLAPEGYAATLIQGIVHPAEAMNSCKVKITRTIEGLAITICVVAIAALLYFIFGPGAEAIVYVVDVALIGTSGTTAYYAHKTANGLSVQAQVKRLTKEITVLSEAVDRFEASNKQLESQIANIGKENAQFVISNKALDAEVKELKIARQNLQAAIGSIGATGDIQKGLAQLQGELQTQLTMITAKQEELLREGESLAAKYRELVEREAAVTKRLEEAAAQHIDLDESQRLLPSRVVTNVHI